MIRHISGPGPACWAFQPPPLPAPLQRPFKRLSRKRPLPTSSGCSGCRCLPPLWLTQQGQGDGDESGEQAMSPLQMHLLSVEVMSRTLERSMAWEEEHRGDVSASDNRQDAAGDQGPVVEDKPAAADRADAPPRPQRQFGAIYSELYRRRLERLQLTEPGRIDMTTAMLRPRQAERAEPIAGGRRGKKKLPWEDDKAPDPVTHFLFDGRWLGPVRVRYHYRTGSFEVADVPWLEQQDVYQRQHWAVQGLVKLLRPLYAPLFVAKCLSLAALQYSRTLRRRILVPPSWGYGSQYMARGLYACVVMVLLAVLIDDVVFVFLRSLLSVLTRGRYRMPELRAFRIHFPGEEVIL